MSDNVKVAVRMRPFNSREKGMNAKCCIEMEQDTQSTIITNPDDGKTRKFTFDYSYNSFVPRDHPEYASQDTVWKDIGLGVLDNAFSGYNTSLFAYGQTGAGKSYSMMGYGEDKGIIPIACTRIFERIGENTDDSVSFKVEASMLEIYMEKVRDLFAPDAGELKIRLDPKKGFFVQGLTRNVVGDFASIDKLMEAGTKARTVASTNMNATSSRAHTIFQINFTQTTLDAAAGKATDRTSIINLIDLAGSERQKGTGATGARLKEGSAINLSLSSLGNVISALAHNSDSTKKKKKVPYRDSVLTMLLQNSLGGNAKTIMIAAISPADVNYDETLSTLRYADRAKQIKNAAVVNEDPNEKLIRSLREEVEQLKKMLGGEIPTADASGGADVEAIRKQMEEERDRELARMRAELEAKMKAELAETARGEIAATDALARRRQEELAAMGVMTGEERTKALERAKTEKHLANLHEDPMMNEQLLYFFDKSKPTVVGRSDADPAPDIRLDGLSIQAHHAEFNMAEDGTVWLLPKAEGAKVFVNGEPVRKPGDAGDDWKGVQIRHRYRVVFGNNFAFRADFPDDVAAGAVPEEDAEVPETIDFGFAISELNKAQVRAIAAEEAKRRAEAERLRTEAEEQIRKMQEQMRVEREKAQREAEERQKFYEEQSKAAEAAEVEEIKKKQEAMMKEAQKRQEDLERQLQEQIRKTEEIAARKQREMRERSLLDEKLLKTIPLVNEANAIADEIGKPLRFEVKLMANQSRRASAMIPRGKSTRTRGTNDEDGSDDDGSDDDDEGNATEQLDTEVYIRVSPRDDDEGSGGAAAGGGGGGGGKKGITALWSHDDFMERLYSMREMYQAFVENNRSVEGLGYEGESDPFWIRPEYQLLGTASVYLDPLLYVMGVRDPVPILDYRGEEQGQLVARIIPHVSDDPPETEDDEAGELPKLMGGDDADADADADLSAAKGKRIKISVLIDAARGLPLDRSVGTEVRFRFFLDEMLHKTPAIEGKAMNPKINYRQTFEQVITDELVEWINSGSMEFEVWAMPDDGSAKMAKPRPATFAGGGGGGGGGGGASSFNGAAGGGAGDDAAILAREAAEAKARARELESQLEEAERRAASPRADADAERRLKEVSKRAEEAEKRAKAKEDEVRRATERAEAAEARAKALEEATKGDGDAATAARAAAEAAEQKSRAEALERRLKETEELQKKEKQDAEKARKDLEDLKAKLAAAEREKEQLRTQASNGGGGGSKACVIA